MVVTKSLLTAPVYSIASLKGCRQVNSAARKEAMRLGTAGRRCFALAGFLTLVAVLPAGPAAGQAQDVANRGHSKKPAWQWTIDERIAARFDPARTSARKAEAAARREKWRQSFGIDLPEGHPSVEGRIEPELFLPTELFTALLSDAFPVDGQPREMKERAEEGAVVLGFGSDLWPRLEKSAALYLRMQKESYEHAMAARGRPIDSEEDEAQVLLACRARAEALARAKAEFGDELFLRLLYEVVATPMSISYTGEDGTAEHLRFVEGGCR